MNAIATNRSLKQAISAAGAVAALALPLTVAADIRDEHDGSWVSLSGKVASHTPKSFTLDYGEGTVTVETDDWDTIGDGWAISEGDQVTVYGRVDDGFYQRRTIEAGSIYVDDLNTLTTAPSPTDEEDVGMVSHSYLSVPADFDLQVVGTVTSVTDREFTIDTGDRKVSVDTLQMPYNPLDDKGLVQIEEGDFVSVSGDLDLGVFDENEISAETIISYN